MSDCESCSCGTSSSSESKNDKAELKMLIKELHKNWKIQLSKEEEHEWDSLYNVSQSNSFEFRFLIFKAKFQLQILQEVGLRLSNFNAQSMKVTFHRLFRRKHSKIFPKYIS